MHIYLYWGSFRERCKSTTLNTSMMLEDDLMKSVICIKEWTKSRATASRLPTLWIHTKSSFQKYLTDNFFPFFFLFLCKWKSLFSEVFKILHFWITVEAMMFFTRCGLVNTCCCVHKWLMKSICWVLKYPRWTGFSGDVKVTESCHFSPRACHKPIQSRL